MAFCIECGKEIQEGATFCTGCGSPVVTKKAKAIKAQPKGKVNKTLIILVSVICGTLLIGVGLVFGIKGLVDYFKRDITTTVVNEKKYGIFDDETIYTAETIASGMNDMGFLVTANYYYTHAESYSDSLYIEGFAIPGTKTSFVYTCDGVITAGVNFEEAEIEVDKKHDVITITLPPAVIFSNEIDEDTFQILDSTTGLFNPLHVEDVTTSFTDMKHAEEEKALDKGVLEDAEKYAEIIVKNFISGIDVNKKYEIVVVFARPVVD